MGREYKKKAKHKPSMRRADDTKNTKERCCLSFFRVPWCHLRLARHHLLRQGAVKHSEGRHRGFALFDRLPSLFCTPHFAVSFSASQ